eukprot:1075254_1
MNLVLEQEEESDASSEYMQNMQKCVRFYQYFYPNPSMEQLMDEFTNAAAAADMIVNTMEAQHKQVKPKGIVLEKENRNSKRNKVLGIRMDKADHMHAIVVRLEYEWIEE